MSSEPLPLWSPNHAWKPSKMLEQPSDGRQAASRSGAVSRISPARGRVGEVLPRHRYALACPCLVAACLRASCSSLPTLPMERPIVVAISE